jgi:hypothetical protein
MMIDAKIYILRLCLLLTLCRTRSRARSAPGTHHCLYVLGQGRCDNLEGYGDYENRLPRGRTYVRNGSVVDISATAWISTAALRPRIPMAAQCAAKGEPAFRASTSGHKGLPRLIAYGR